MYQRDYILRMIEMMAELIAGILGLVRKGNYQEAEEAIEGAYTNMLKENAAFFRNIPNDELCDTLLQQHNYTYDHLGILAELFYAEGELLHTQNKPECMEHYEKALILLVFVDRESTSFSMQRKGRIRELQSKLDNSKTQ